MRRTRLKLTWSWARAKIAFGYWALAITYWWLIQFSTPWVESEWPWYWRLPYVLVLAFPFGWMVGSAEVWYAERERDSESTHRR